MLRGVFAGAVLLIAIPASAQTFSAWSTVLDPGGALSVTTGAALAGTSYGMQGNAANVATGASAYVEDQTPANEPRYRARFYVNPNTLDPGNAAGSNRTRVYTAVDADGGTGTPGSRRLVMVALRKVTGSPNYSIIVRLYRGPDYIAPVGGSNYEQFGPYDLGATVATHFVEFDWQKATASGANNGVFTLWIDNTQMASITDLPIFDYGVDTARLGYIAILAGANGNVYLDEFESRRLTYIGALP